MGLRGTLRPDAAGEYRARGQRVRFWLEWDTGSMSAALLRQKLERYATYADTTTWRMEEERAAVPLLMIVVPDVAQEERITRLVDELVERGRLRWPGPLLIRVTTATRLAQAGPLAPIWRPLLPAALPPSGAAGPQQADLAAGAQATRETMGGYLGLVEHVPPAPPRSGSTGWSPRTPAGQARRPSAGAEQPSPATARPVAAGPHSVPPFGPAKAR
jgi:hypothetical protein